MPPRSSSRHRGTVPPEVLAAAATLASRKRSRSELSMKSGSTTAARLPRSASYVPRAPPPRLKPSPAGVPKPKLHTLYRKCTECSRRFFPPTSASPDVFSGMSTFCDADCHTAYARRETKEEVTVETEPRAPPSVVDPSRSEDLKSKAFYKALKRELEDARCRVEKAAEGYGHRVSFAASVTPVPTSATAAAPRGAHTVSAGVDTSGRIDALGSVLTTLLGVVAGKEQIRRHLDLLKEKRRGAAASSARAGEGAAAVVRNLRTKEDIARVQAELDARRRQLEAGEAAVLPAGAVEELRKQKPQLFDRSYHSAFLRTQWKNHMNWLEQLKAGEYALQKALGKIGEDVDKLRRGQRSVREVYYGAAAAPARVAFLEACRERAEGLLAGAGEAHEGFKVRMAHSRDWEKRPTADGAGVCTAVQEVVLELHKLEVDVVAHRARLRADVAALLADTGQERKPRAGGAECGAGEGRVAGKKRRMGGEAGGKGEGEGGGVGSTDSSSEQPEDDPEAMFTNRKREIGNAKRAAKQARKERKKSAPKAARKNKVVK